VRHRTAVSLPGTCGIAGVTLVSLSSRGYDFLRRLEAQQGPVVDTKGYVVVGSC
jgi:hypothetical protein